MAREQPNAGDLLPLLESSDLQQLEEIKGLINEHLSTGQSLIQVPGSLAGLELIPIQVEQSA